jgi:hypothetical protein
VVGGPFQPYQPMRCLRHPPPQHALQGEVPVQDTLALYIGLPGSAIFPLNSQFWRASSCLQTLTRRNTLRAAAASNDRPSEDTGAPAGRAAAAPGGRRSQA